jgi:hypothetical protein
MTDERAEEVVAALRYGPVTLAELLEAADELERLRERWQTAEKQWRVEADHRRAVEGESVAKDAEIARLREALKPFAALWTNRHGTDHPNEIPYLSVNVDLTHCKLAAEVLK